MSQKDDAVEGRKKAGEYIKKLRLDAGLSQLDLSKRLGYAYYSFISQIEGGATRVPPESLREWARALGVDINPFATTLLRYYEPYYFDAIFSAPHQGGRKSSSSRSKRAHG